MRNHHRTGLNSPRGGYTKVPHWIEDLMPKLDGSAYKLLSCVARFTYGFHRAACALAMAILCERTGMHETSIRRARSTLEEMGVLKVEMRLVRGQCLNVYRLVPPVSESEADIEDSNDAAGATVATADGNVPAEGTHAQSMGPCTVHGRAMHRAWHVNKVPSNEGKIEQQHETAPTKAAKPKPVTGPSPVPTHRPVVVPFKIDLTEEQATILDQMKAVGVGRTMALRLIESTPAEIIRRALDSLPHRNARRPAAVLVAELQDGGWEEPPAVAERRKREEEADLRRAREEAEERRRQQEIETRESASRKALAGLRPDERSRLFEEARARIRPWAGHLPGAMEEGSPILQGAVLQILEERGGAAMRSMGERGRLVEVPAGCG